MQCKDADNQHFALVSESFSDPGPHGACRYSDNMLHDMVNRDWRKGAQCLAVNQQHAVLFFLELYHGKFKCYCKNIDG